MNRRKPHRVLAVVPQEAGQDAASAVLHKACRAALASLAQQKEVAAGGAVLDLFAGYLAGYARHEALRHGVDAEHASGSAAPMQALVRELLALSQDHLHPALSGLRFEPRSHAASRRTALRAVSVQADAGYLLGHLESLCGTRRLLLGQGRDVASFLTACDLAADRMQTHHPTAALRLDGEERRIVAEAFASLD